MFSWLPSQLVGRVRAGLTERSRSAQGDACLQPASCLQVVMPPGACHLKGALSQDWALCFPDFLTEKTMLRVGPGQRDLLGRGSALAVPWEAGSH